MHNSALRLAATYLAIIMVMSGAFSFTIYQISSNQIGRQLPPDRIFVRRGEDPRIVRDFFEMRINEARHDLLTRLVWLNILVFGLGATLSVLLARRTLDPIEQAMETQARFASDASHELRTPLAAMQTENEVALRDKKLTLPRAKMLLTSNLEEVVRLRNLADTLLQLARQDPVQITAVPVPVAEAVSEAINNSIKAAQAKKIAIEDVVPKLTVLGDLPRITQILSIFIDNAIKYSPEKSTVTVAAKAEGKSAVISVTDSGAGISRKDLPHIFERFYRADSSRTKQAVEGHGLGLSLAQQLAEQLGGELGVNSKPGKGSTFTLRLPLA